jgi:hypothetical protein
MLPADDPGKAPFWEGRLAAGDIPGISAISQIGTFLKDGPIHDNPAFAARTPPGEVIDSARWRVPSASNFGEPPGQSQSTIGFVSVDRSQRGQGTGDSSLIRGRRRAAIGAERASYRCTARKTTCFSIRFPIPRRRPRVSLESATQSINNACGRLRPANAAIGFEGSGHQRHSGSNRRAVSGSAGSNLLGGVCADELTPRMPAQASRGGTQYPSSTVCEIESARTC